MHPKAEKFRTVISKYVPGNSVDYLLKLWLQHPFHLRVTKTRQSKHGDYQYNPQDRSHMITVNGSLNPYMFLVTFIHEVAHQRNYMQQGYRAIPHGRPWKDQFRVLINPVMHEGIFPEDILEALKLHMKNPKASSDADLRLTRLLHRYNKGIQVNTPYLESVKPGEKFRLQGKVYLKIERKRTRALCREIGSGREFLIPELTNIDKIH